MNQKHSDVEKPPCCVPDGRNRPNRNSENSISPESIDVVASGQKRPCRLVEIPAGRSFMGTNRPLLSMDGEGPFRKVTVGSFSVDPHAVTNQWFGQFVGETGYITDAERFGWSVVFHKHLPDPAGLPRVVNAQWWVRVEGACWSHPTGPNSTIDELQNHPATHISWNDANAFATWAGGRLPREAEWECVARAGQGDVRYLWGDDEPQDDGEHFRCNIWQGDFPNINTMADGFGATAPVDAFPANPWGLYNLVGNVWEWCADPFKVSSLKRDAKRRNLQALQAGEKLLKGGSFLCHRSYCTRYRIAARTGVQADSSAAHTGMRIVFDH
jgi:sulfatase modifying factor 1